MQVQQFSENQGLVLQTIIAKHGAGNYCTHSLDARNKGIFAFIPVKGGHPRIYFRGACLINDSCVFVSTLFLIKTL